MKLDPQERLIIQRLFYCSIFPEQGIKHPMGKHSPGEIGIYSNENLKTIVNEIRR